MAKGKQIQYTVSQLTAQLTTIRNKYKAKENEREIVRAQFDDPLAETTAGDLRHSAELTEELKTLGKEYEQKRIDLLAAQEKAKQEAANPSQSHDAANTFSDHNNSSNSSSNSPPPSQDGNEVARSATGNSAAASVSSSNDNDSSSTLNKAAIKKQKTKEEPDAQLQAKQRAEQKKVLQQKQQAAQREKAEQEKLAQQKKAEQRAAQQKADREKAELARQRTEQEKQQAEQERKVKQQQQDEQRAQAALEKKAAKEKAKQEKLEQQQKEKEQRKAKQQQKEIKTQNTKAKHEGERQQKAEKEKAKREKAKQEKAEREEVRKKALQEKTSREEAEILKGMEEMKGIFAALAAQKDLGPDLPRNVTRKLKNLPKEQAQVARSIFKAIEKGATADAGPEDKREEVERALKTVEAKAKQEKIAQQVAATRTVGAVREEGEEQTEEAARKEAKLFEAISKVAYGLDEIATLKAQGKNVSEERKKALEEELQKVLPEESIPMAMSLIEDARLKARSNHDDGGSDSPQDDGRAGTLALDNQQAAVDPEAQSLELGLSNASSSSGDGSFASIIASGLTMLTTPGAILAAAGAPVGRIAAGCSGSSPLGQDFFARHHYTQSANSALPPSSNPNGNFPLLYPRNVGENQPDGSDFGGGSPNSPQDNSAERNAAADYRNHDSAPSSSSSVSSSSIFGTMAPGILGAGIAFVCSTFEASSKKSKTPPDNGSSPNQEDNSVPLAGQDKE